ncbi:MAG: peptidylprolyl isomerase [Planctomycetes bacterium]|nr:peptidylprolyl isomerase [Planctomycetota bacterium]
MQITEHTVVLLDYKLTDDDGELIDASEDGQPLAYVHGTGSIIPGLERELDGKQDGDALSVRIAPEDAYGEHDETLLHTVARSQLPAEVEIEEGMQFEAESDEGEVQVLTVVEIDGEDITLDGNHPLAGVALNFEVKVVGVRQATAEEIEHGHVHGPGGHAH